MIKELLEKKINTKDHWLLGVEGNPTKHHGDHFMTVRELIDLHNRAQDRVKSIQKAVDGIEELIGHVFNPIKGIKPPMKRYIAIHKHNHGTDTLHFKSTLPISELPRYEAMAERLGANYDPENGDSFDVFELGDLEDVQEIRR